MDINYIPSVYIRYLLDLHKYPMKKIMFQSSFNEEKIDDSIK